MERHKSLVTAPASVLSDFLADVYHIAVKQDIPPLQNRLTLQPSDQLTRTEKRKS
jgi:hypothetical protein